MEVTKLIIRLCIVAAVYFVPDFFVSSGIKSFFRKNPKQAKRIYLRSSIIFFLIIVCILMLSGVLPATVNRANAYILGIFTGFVFFKIFVAGILLAEDVFRIPLSFIKRKERKKAGKTNFISRRKFISQVALFIGVLPFSGFMYGMLKGKYDFTVHKEILYLDTLPQAFDGITLTHFSDLHIGSWNNFEKEKLEQAADIIKSLQSDILFFTGDIVNSRATEMDGWFDVFKNFTASLGKFSILGNHDYGDYVKWKTENEKEENLQQVKNIHPQLGFDLLLNENRVIEKDGEKMYLLGVENWGTGDFPKFGDLKKAGEGVPDDAFKILLSHDPSHWDAKVLQETFPPQLTLSGHTHGFQMGIETPAFRFSPSQWIYEQWAGLYEKNERYIYVNRGLGTVGYPGRIGVWPEITQITLKKK